MYIRPTNDIRIKMILLDELLESMFVTIYFCDLMVVNLVDER